VNKVPAPVLSRFLGADETSVLNHVLNHRKGMRVAVIVNDMSEVNIDARLVDRSSALSWVDEKLVSMTNGCICCTVGDDKPCWLTRTDAPSPILSPTRSSAPMSSTSTSASHC
jgi:G3E family GTPase